MYQSLKILNSYVKKLFFKIQFSMILEWYDIYFNKL